MPELPEVETTLRGIKPHIQTQTIAKVIIRQHQLRWKIDDKLPEILAEQPVLNCERRAKYLILTFPSGILIIHLGMSGSLRILTQESAPDKHDHVDFIFHNNTILRYHDPRRFGAILWFNGIAQHHPLLQNLGTEPLSKNFTANYLFQRLQHCNRNIKVALMDNHIVVGVGNIYANESLFQAGILPTRLAKAITFEECKQLVNAIKTILKRAITQGGSTLRDFVNSDGKSGYFQQEYMVYSRQNLACKQCGTLIKKIVLAQRASFYCSHCQH